LICTKNEEEEILLDIERLMYACSRTVNGSHIADSVASKTANGGFFSDSLTARRLMGLDSERR
jgi:hypothetical protein